MVVKSRAVELEQLDLGYLALFFGLRVNEMVKERAAAAGFPDLRDSHGYLIQHLIESGRSISELARRMEVTQQAASKAVAELAGLGVLEMAPGADRRVREVRLSKRGWAAVRFARRRRRQIERRIVRAVGAEEYQRAKSILMAGLEAAGARERIRARRIRQPL
jgi:DNA-binding MarR family transcriptional regulator